MAQKDGDTVIITTLLTMRRIIGILGMSLPFIVVVGGFLQNGFTVQSSISSYYYTNMRDIFIGVICIVGLYLISYRGYERIDDVVTNISGSLAFGVVVFPTSQTPVGSKRVGVFLLSQNVSQILHLTCASLLFLSLAFISIFLFTRTGQGSPTPEKLKRNRVYVGSGVVMVISIVCMVMFVVFLEKTSLSRIDPLLVLEAVALTAFGVSWLVKGNTLFKDLPAGHGTASPGG